MEALEMLGDLAALSVELIAWCCDFDGSASPAVLSWKLGSPDARTRLK